mmetsp:Transcript_96074/g.296284  ORF Transcript_96074/g.296284 Transcript_96074/m.296284 type:complete len:233 (-) Transcript_96074:293-991(-)
MPSRGCSGRYSEQGQGLLCARRAMVGTAACGPPSRGGPPGLGSRRTQRRRHLRARRLAGRPRRALAEPGSGYNVYGDRHSLLGGTSSDVFLRGGIRECIRTFGIETYVPQAPCGVPQIEVTFDIDANGILYVSDGGRGTGKEQTITGSPTQDKADVERRVQDAGDNDAEDDKRKESVETRNNVECGAYAVFGSAGHDPDGGGAARLHKRLGRHLAVRRLSRISAQPLPHRGR